MIETTVLDYLRDRLGVPVTMEVPEGASGTFVVLEKTGSSRQNYIRRATLAVQSYAPTLLQAAQLDDAVIEAMLALPTLDQVGPASWSAITILPIPKPKNTATRRCLR